MTASHIMTFTGPSGVGKSTVRRALVLEQPDRFIVVPMVTTRAPKTGDQDEYAYVTLAEFHRMRDDGTLSAFTRVPGNEDRWYGYAADVMRRLQDRGQTLLFITDEILLSQLRSFCGSDALYSVGMLPPGNTDEEMIAVLTDRLQGRGRDTPLEIQDRLMNARADIASLRRAGSLYDVLLVNDDLSASVQTLVSAFS